MRALLLFFVLLAAADQASAQIFAIHFKDEKAAGRYRKNLVNWNGEDVVVGEARSGITYDAERRNITYLPAGRLELFVADPQDPSSVPYRLEGGERIPLDRKQILGVQGQHVGRISVLIHHQSLQGLAEEYRTRLDQVEEYTRAREASEKGSREWFASHQRVVASLERLQRWLASTAFPDAAKRLEREIERQRKSVQADAVAARLETARKAIRKVDTPPELIEASAAITGGNARFRVQHSQHIRIVYLEEIGDERIRNLLDFGELLIAGFRADCVDPYVDEHFEDKIPDRLFSEFWFGPERLDHHEAFFVAYYKQSWGARKEERLKNSGARARLNTPPEHLDYWKYREDSDLDGILAHCLGHTLATIHYNLNRPGMEQDWLSEGAGLYLSLEYLGRNTVTCKAFAPEGRYVHEKRQAEGEKTLQVGLRGYYNALALELGPVLDRLALKKLFEMEDGDLAKSWSFYDYVVRREGRRGQEFLRSACQHSRTPSSFIQKWREESEGLWKVKGRDVFRLIDDAWREFATSGQDTGDTGRRRSLGRD